MISGVLAESFNNKQMVISSGDELAKRQKECMSRFTGEMINPNSNNSNNRGNAYNNIEDVRQSANHGNPSSTTIPRSSDMGSPRLKQERDFMSDEFGNRGMDSDSDRNDQAHMNEKRFSCEHCGNSFTDPSNLQRHIRQNHAGARAHPCPECGKTFATSSGLKQHQHIHSSIKPFTCEVCRKSYTQFSNLCRHKRMHADCRVRIKCGNCGEYFPTSSALNKHRRFCDAKSLFPDRPKVLDYGIAPGSAQISPSGQVEGSPPQLLRDSLRHLSGTSLLDFTPGRNPATVNSRIRNGIDANSQCLPYLFSCSFPTPGLQLTPKEADNTKGKVGFPENRSPTQNVSPKAMPGTSTASVQIQCNDPVADCIKMSLSRSNEPHGTLRVDSTRFKGVERKVKYSPKSRHSEVQISPGRSPSSSPSRIDIPSSSAFSQRPELMKSASYYNPTYPLFRECPQSQLSPPTKLNSERNILQGSFADNFKRMLDEMVERQKFFNLASAFAKAPSLYRPGMFSAGDIPYTSFSYLPHCQRESEKPLDLSLNRLRSELGFSPKASAFGGEKSPSTTPLQKLNSPTEVFDDGVADIRRIAWPAPLYPPYSLLKSDPNLLRFYSGLHGSLPFGKTTVPYTMPPRPGLVSSHHPALSPGRMFTMLNSQRRMYDLLQRDYSGLNRRNAPQQVLEHSPNQNPGDIPRSYGGSCQYGFGRGNGRYDREKYVCKYCGKLFPRSANLTRHLRTHTGEQPYSCKYCDRNFSISSNLQRHVRNIHKKERPYCCPLCKRAFGQQTNLERHLRKHLEKPESVVTGNLPQNLPQLGSANAEITHQACEANERNSLSPRHSNDGRSSDWNEENSSRNELHTSSDEDSFDTSLPTSTSFSPNNGISPHRKTNDSLHIVSSEE